MLNAKLFNRARQVTAFLLVLALTVALFAGCGGTQNPPGSSTSTSSTASQQSTKTQEDVTIRIAWWGNQLRNDGTVAMLDAYTQENPHVKYEAEFSDWGGYWERMVAQAASNTLPDIMQHDLAYIAQYHAKGQLASLTEQINAGNLNVSDISESILAAGSFNGELFALCLGVSSPSMFYNTRLAKEAGIEVPLRVTYQDVMDMSAKVYEATGVRGTTPPYYGIDMMCRDVGELYLDPVANRIGASEATVLKHFKQIKATIESEWALPVDILQEDVTAGIENNSFATGKSWNTFNTSNTMAAYQAVMDDTVGIAMNPTTEGATHESMYLKPSQFFCIPANSTNKEEAARIIDYFINNEKAQDILQAERGVPVSSKMNDYLRPKLTEEKQRIFAYIAEVSKIAVPADPPSPNGANEILTLLNDYTDMVRYGQITPEDATARFLPEAQAILDKANA